MANFATDLFGAITGQKSNPQQTIIPTSDLLSQAYQTSTALAPQVVAYNAALAPGLTDVQLGVESQFDPNIAALRSSTSKSILDQLNLGTGLPQDLQDQVIASALSQSAQSGFGVGQGGRGLVAADLGLTGLQLQRQRQGDAAGYVRSSPSLSSLYQPSRGPSPEAIASDIRDVQAAKDDYANLVEDTRQKNFASLLSTGTRIAGSVVGGIFGGAMGAQIGGQAGSAVISGGGVAGQQQPQAQGGGFTSLLTGLFSGGGNAGQPVGGGIGGGRVQFGASNG